MLCWKVWTSFHNSGRISAGFWPKKWRSPWLCFKMVNLSGWIHEERNIACKKMGSLKEHYDICPDRENLRTSCRAVMVCMPRGKRKKKEGRPWARALLPWALDLWLSRLAFLEFWLSDSVFPYPSLLPFPCGNPDSEGQSPFSEYLPVVSGRSRFFLSELLFRWEDSLPGSCLETGRL